MPRIAVATALAAALISRAQAQTSLPLPDAVPSITVEGSAKREIAPDLAVASVGVDTVRSDATEASNANAKAAAALIATARQQGIAAKDIVTSDLALATITDQRDASKIKGFRASNHVTFRVHDLSKVPALLGALVGQGANAVEGVDFAVEDPRPLLDELRTKATQDAADAARVYAKAAGVSLGRILRIAPDSGSPVPMARAFKVRMADAPAPAPPVEAGTQALEVRVRVTWELVP